MSHEPLTGKILHSQGEALMGILAEVRNAVNLGKPADATLSAFYRSHRQFGSRDRRLFSDTVFSFFRWKGWLELMFPDNPRAAAVFAHLLDAKECHPAIRHLAGTSNIPAEALRPLGALPIKEKPLVLSRQISAFLPGLTPPSILQLVPAWFADVLPPPGRNPAADALDELIASFQIPPPTWVRLRPSSGLDLPVLFSQSGIEVTRHPRIPNAAAVARGSNLQGLAPRFRSGLEIQDLASQAVGCICEATAGQSWWDACAGSGGKTLHLADRVGPSGRVLATDIRPSVLEELARRAETDNLQKEIRIKVWDGASHPPPPGSFDGVLLDAPCSGIGTWHRNPDARWRCTRESISALAALQLRLLQACALRVRPGGRLVYTTCTMTREENQGVVEAFLSAQPGFRLDPFPDPLRDGETPGILTIHPWDGPCNGMFIARLLRIDNP